MKYIFIALCLIIQNIGFAKSSNHWIKYNRTVIPESYIIADSNGYVIKQQDGNVQRPIASISKLIVAFIASSQDLTENLEIPSKRLVNSVIPMHQITLSREELITLALVKSDNFAAQILCNNIPNCVNAMNNKAQEIGMFNTHYEEPTGLSKNNVSTANDLLKLLIAVSTNETITRLSSMPSANIVSGKHIIHVNNTNPLTHTLNIILSKTGFTNPAGQCLVMGARSPIGIRYFILLGSKNRIPEMQKLYNETTQVR